MTIEMDRSDEVVWERPPMKVWVERLQPFMAPERVGEWGRLPGDYDPGVATRLRAGAKGDTCGIAVVPPGRWEFRLSTKGMRYGRAQLWARFLGPA